MLVLIPFVSCVVLFSCNMVLFCLSRVNERYNRRIRQFQEEKIKYLQRENDRLREELRNNYN